MILRWFPSLVLLIASAVYVLAEAGDTPQMTLARAVESAPRDNASSLSRLSRSWADAVDTAHDPAAAKNAARRALDLAEQAVKADPKNAQAHLALAIACGKETDFVDSKTKLALSRQIRTEAEQAIALDPKLDLAYHVLGRWHLGMASVNPFFRFGARLTMGALPPASLSEAVRNLEKAAELSPKTIIHHQHLALAYQAVGKRTEAAHQWHIVLGLPATDREDEEAKRQARAALGR